MGFPKNWTRIWCYLFTFHYFLRFLKDIRTSYTFLKPICSYIKRELLLAPPKSPRALRS
jgi:hypothetical protein